MQKKRVFQMVLIAFGFYGFAAESVWGQVTPLPTATLVAKSVNLASASLGQTLIYTIHLTNPYPAPVTCNDDFSADTPGAPPTGWTAPAGSCSASAGAEGVLADPTGAGLGNIFQLQATTAGDQSCFSTDNCASSVGDGSISALIYLPSGTGARAELLWRQSAADDYQASIGFSGYSNQNYEIHTVTDGVYNNLGGSNSGEILPGGTTAPVLSANQWVTVGMNVSGFTINMIVNGVRVATATDTNQKFHAGAAGLQASFGGTAYFADVQIASSSTTMDGTLSDTLPTGVSYLTAGGNFSHSQIGNEVLFNVPAIGGGASKIAIVEGIVTGCTNPVVNTASFNVAGPYFGVETSAPVSTSMSCPPTSTPTTSGSAPTPTDSMTATPTVTVTATPSMTPSPTPSSTSGPASSPSPSSTSTPTPTPSWTVSATQTKTATSTLTPTASMTATPSPTRTVTPSSTSTGTATASPTATSSATSTVFFTSTGTPALTVPPSATKTGTATSTATATSTLTRTWTATPTASTTATPTSPPTLTASAAPSQTSTATATASPTATASLWATPTPTPLPPSATFTPTDTFSASPTPTSMVLFTSTPTETPQATSTFTPTPTFSATSSMTATSSPTVSATASSTPTPIPTSSWTSTPSLTASGTATPPFTPTGTSTVTSTPLIAQMPVLEGPYPNPAQAGFPVKVDLKTAGPGQVRWTVFTTAFRKIAGGESAVDGAGSIEWDLRDGEGGQAANGVYYLRVEVDGVQPTTKTFKVLVLR